MDIYIQIEEFDFHILYWAKKTTKTIDLYKRKSPILFLWTNSTFCNIQTKLSDFPLKQSQQTLKSTKLKPSFRPHFGNSRHEHLKFVKTTGVWPKKIIIVGPPGTDNLLHHSLGFIAWIHPKRSMNPQVYHTLHLVNILACCVSYCSQPSKKLL